MSAFVIAEHPLTTPFPYLDSVKFLHLVFPQANPDSSGPSPTPYPRPSTPFLWDNYSPMSSPDAPTHNAPATDLRQDSLHLLEFHLVRERLAGHTTYAPARQQALDLAPSYDATQVLRSQQETSEGRRFLERGSALDLSGASDIGPLLRRASLGGILRGDELRQVGNTAQAARLARETLLRQRDLPLLRSIAEDLPDLKALESSLAGSIADSGEVLDGASPLLGKLRADARQAYQQLNDSLQRALRRLQRQGVLQEPVITERNGRLVLLVRMDMKQHLHGIVHDVSDSGATVFVEPLSAVPLGNQWRELGLAVEREEGQVLRSLSEKVAAFTEDLEPALELLARLDLTMAKARYSLALKARTPVLAEQEHPSIHLVEMCHPLLTGDVVPVSVDVGGPQPVLLITGPNAGGKTVALKTVGLSVLMAQAGLHLPATEATLSLFDGVYVDIGDQQSIQRSLSTFSSHVQTLRDTMGRATPSSLVLLDELGTSTDPEEGTAIAKASLAYFAGRGITLVATTHYRDVAAFVQEAPDMINASVELDPHTLEPTYRLTTGLPGRSYALTIAARHGLDQDVIGRAQSLLAPAHQQSERLLRELQEERHLADRLRREAEQARNMVEQEAARLQEQLAALEDGKAEMLEEFRIQLQERAEALLKKLQRAERALARAGPATPWAPPWPAQTESETPAPSAQEELEEVTQVQRELDSAEWQPSPSRRADWLRHLRSGDRVYLRGVPQPVEVISPPGDGTTLEVLLGSMRATLPLYQVERLAQAHEAAARHGVFLSQPAHRQAKSEVDLRGQRVEDALDQVETALSNAALDGLSALRIIHGVGTGALRSAIRDHLSRHSLVKSVGRDETTLADGATIVDLI